MLDKCCTNIQLNIVVFGSWGLGICKMTKKSEDVGSEVSSQGSHQFVSNQINLSKKRTYSGGSLSKMTVHLGKKEHEVDYDKIIADWKNTANNVQSGLVLDHYINKPKTGERQSLEELLLKVMKFGKDTAHK